MQTRHRPLASAQSGPRPARGLFRGAKTCAGLLRADRRHPQRRIATPSQAESVSRSQRRVAPEVSSFSFERGAQTPFLTARQKGVIPLQSRSAEEHDQQRPSAQITSKRKMIDVGQIQPQFILVAQSAAAGTPRQSPLPPEKVKKRDG